MFLISHVQRDLLMMCTRKDIQNIQENEEVCASTSAVGIGDEVPFSTNIPSLKTSSTAPSINVVSDDIPVEKTRTKGKKKASDPLVVRKSSRGNRTSGITLGDVDEQQVCAVVSTEDYCLKRTMKPSATPRSPFYYRFADLSLSQSELEKLLSDYVSKDIGSSTDVFFQYKTCQITRAELRYLEDGIEVSTLVFNVWVVVLNHKEQYKNPSTPSRLFLTTSHSCYTITENPKLFEEQCKKFAVSVDALELAPHIVLKDVDMGEMLAHYLLNHKCVKKSEIIFQSKVSDVSIPLAGDDKKTHTGICAMCHMETSLGTEKSYKCGIEKGNCKVMPMIRLRYLSELVLSDMNEVRVEVIVAACTHAKMTSKGVEVKKLRMNI